MHRMGAMSGYVRGIDEGAAYDWRGARAVIKASSKDTFGQLGVMESTYPPALHPLHHHPGEDEMLYVLAGEMQGFCDDSRGDGYCRQLRIRAQRPSPRLRCHQRRTRPRAGDRWAAAVRTVRSPRPEL